MEPAKFDGSHVIRFLNLYHGVKVDLVLRKMLQSEIVFLCDDDMYLLKDISKTLNDLDDPKLPSFHYFPAPGGNSKSATGILAHGVFCPHF